ncbi:MAG TPA: cupin domain-containing protein [Dehalococcoidia bacterium]|nr:cupin domain-containing protein [Dehalococcoidia bacterium]
MIKLPINADTIAPDGSEIRLLPEMSRGGICHCTLSPGKTSIAIKHKTIEEIWYCLEGEGEVWRKMDDNEQVIKVNLGISLTIPTGTHFQFRNTGTQPLCFIITTMPPWPGPSEAVKVKGRW